MANSKVADLAGPGIGNYTQLEKVLPNDYSSALTRRETQNAIFAVKRFIEDNLCKELNLIMVALPLIVDVESGGNDMLDRDGSRTAIQFHIINNHNQHAVNLRSSRQPPSGRRAETVWPEDRRRPVRRHARRSQRLFPGP